MNLFRRSLILVIALLLYTAFMAVLATVTVWTILGAGEGFLASLQFITQPRQWDFDDTAWWAYCGVPVLVLVASQAVFLWPLRDGAVRSKPDGKPLMRMLVIVGFVGAAMTLALFVGLAATAQLIWSYQTGEDPADYDIGQSGFVLALVMAGVLVIASWVFWTFVLYQFAARQPKATRFSRLVGMLLAGTVVETLVILPVDIMMRRRTECYCGTGTFYSLCFSAWALFWLAGPGAFLAVTSKRRRAWEAGCCVKCWHVKGPSPAAVCPECGHDWSNSPGHAAMEE